MNSPSSRSELTDSQGQEIKRIADLYEKAWQHPSARDRPPDLRAFLPPTPGRLRELALRRLVEIDLEAHWQHKQPIYLEDYLTRYPELGNARRLPLELIYGEYRNRHLYGDRPAATAYEQRFPEQYPKLRQLVEEQGTLVRVDHTPVAPDAPVPSPAPMVSPSDRGMPAAAGNVLAAGGEYKLIKLIGSGSYGEVWRAEAPGRVDVAIKIIRRPLAHEDAQRELQALELIKQLRHPFLLKVHSFWFQQDRLTIVMDLADCSLRDKLKEYKQQDLDGIPPGKLLSYFLQAAEALDFLHEKNVHHRDIKPDNLLLLQGYAQVADLGLARFQETQSIANATVTGSPAYMAPEIWQGKISPQSDQYSLAASYAELRLGRTLHDTKNIAALMIQVLREDPNLAPLAQPEQEVLLRALAKTPDQRFSSCTEFMQALTEAVPHLPERPSTNIKITRPNMEELFNRRDSSRSSGPRGSETPVTPQPDEPVEPPPPPPRRSPVRTLLSVVVVAAAVLGGIQFFWPRSSPQVPPVPGSIQWVPPAPCVVIRGKGTKTTLCIERRLFRQPVKLRVQRTEHITITAPDIPSDGTSSELLIEADAAASLKTHSISITAEAGGQSYETRLELTVVFLPEGFTAVSQDMIKDERSRSFFRRIESSSPTGAIPFVLIPQTGRPSKGNRDEPRSFYIMVNKVSVDDFRRYIAAAESQDPQLHDQLDAGLRDRLKKADPKFPVLGVTGRDAFRFAEWLGGQGTGSLPTVAQWNKAAGLFEEFKPPWTKGPFKGNRAPNNKLNIAVDLKKPMRVGEAADDEGPFGCRDMAGNGLEWTRSLDNILDGGEVSPVTARSTEKRYVALRGRSFDDTGGPLTYLLLERNDPLGSNEFHKTMPTIGFRVVLEP